MLIGKIIRAFKVFTVQNRQGYWALVIQTEIGIRHDIYSEDPVELNELMKIEYSLRLPKVKDRWKFNFIDSIKRLDKFG
jgi:hypothetical protein